MSKNGFENSGFDIEAAETLKVDRPEGRAHINWEPLAQKIIALPNEHSCLRLHRALNQSVRSSLRNYMGTKHGSRIIMRSPPGQTYIWKGGAL